MADQDRHERRRSERRKLLRTATVTYEGLRWPMPCVLLDISQNGARLSMPAQDFPDEFQLLVESEALSRRCLVVWRRGDEVGVDFLD